MASVRLNGDTSGFIEISAPNVAGSTTITLPATSGGNFLVTDSNGDLNVDSGTLFVDASTNRVGVGTTSPSQNLDVVGDIAFGSSSNGLIAEDGTQIVFKATGATRQAHLMTHDGSEDINLDPSGFIQFECAGTERARIDSSGRLLVGNNTARANFNNSTDTTHLQVEGTNANTSSLALICNNGGGVPVASVHLAKSDGGSVGSNGRVGGQWNVGDIRFSGNDGTQFVEAARIEAEIDGTPAANDMPGRLIFSTTASGATAPTEHMRIAENGRVTINTASQATFIKRADTSSGSAIVEFQNASATVSWMRLDGGLANVQSNDVNLSDEREKKNIESLDSTWSCLKQWKIKKFHYNDQVDTEDKKYGVVAQQVAPHCPEVISDWVKQKAEDAVLDADGNVVTPAKEEIIRMGVKEQQMYWMAIRALQEAQTRIETLETANASLEARLTALEGGN